MIFRRWRAVGIEWVWDGLKHRFDHWVRPVNEAVSFARSIKLRWVAYDLAVNLSNTSILDRTTRHIFKVCQYKSSVVSVS